MRIPNDRTRIAIAVAGVAMALGAGHASGSAFGLAEQSGSGLGNAFAGGAATADDATLVWFNPANMSLLSRPQAAAAIHFITPSIKFQNDGSLPAANQPLGNTGGDAGTLNIVPNMALTFPINTQWSVGLGVNVPFGLVTDYNDTWLGRYQGIKSDVKTINVMPVLSYRVNDQFSIGVGANYQRIDAQFTQAVNYSAGLLQAAALAGVAPGTATYNLIAAQTGGLDGKATIDGDDDAWGWNAGILWQIDRNSRLGVHYRSTIKYDITGNVSFSTPQLPTIQPPQLAAQVAALAAALNASPRLASGGVNASVKVPDKANVSYFRTLNDRWDIMADVQWTGWSSLPELKFVRTTGAVLSATPYNWDDSWRYSVGANYRYNDKLMLRGGVAFDQTPISEEFLTVRLPDSDRWWLSIGAQYKFQPNLWMDAGFTYIFADSASINKTGDPPGCDSPATCVGGYGLVKGSYDASVTIFSLQLTYAF